MSTHPGPRTWTIENIHEGPVDPGMYLTGPEPDAEAFYLTPGEVYTNLVLDLESSSDLHTVNVLRSAELFLGLGQSHTQVVRFLARQIDHINISDEQ